MRLVSFALVSFVAGASVWSCGGNDGSEPSNTGGEGGTNGDGDGDGDTDTETGEVDTDGGDGDPGDGDGDTDGGDGDPGDGDGDECAGDVSRCTDDESQVDVCVDGRWETQECSSSIPLCANDHCDPENCEGCLIDGQCYSDGTSDPENSCQVCDAPSGDWENADNGASCGEHGSCDAGACPCAEGWTGANCETCVVYVKTNGDDGDSGVSWNQALGSVQAALDLAAERLGDADMDSCEVWVAEGTYKPGTEVTSTFQMREGVALYGGFAGDETALADRDWGEHETILSGDVAGDDVAGDLDEGSSPLHREDNAYHVVTGDRDAPLDGVIIRGGGNSEAEALEDQRGGGLLNLSVAPTVRNCLFEDNYAWFDGAAIYTEGSDVIGTVSQSTFERNVSAAGSTVYFGTSEANLEQVLMRDNVNAYGALHAESATLSVKEAQFVTNEADSGGALSVSEGTDLTVENTVFEGNTSSGHGGAVSILRASAQIVGATFANNSAIDASLQNVRGGAVVSADSQVEIANSIFQNNSAQGATIDFGGAIQNWGGAQMSVVNSVFIANAAAGGAAIRNDDEGSALAVTSCTFFANESSEGGGALYNLDGVAHVANSIVWGGSVPTIVSSGSAATETTVSYSDVQGGYSGTENLDVDPKFADAEDADLHLASDSPLINQGDGASLPTDLLDLDDDGNTTEPLPVDLDGNERVIGESVDMGAYERP